MLWDTRTHEVLATMADDEDGLTGLSFSAGGRLLAATHSAVVASVESSGVRIWDVADPRRPRVASDINLDGIPHVVSFAPDGDSLITSAGTSVDVWAISADGKVVDRRTRVTTTTFLSGAAINRDHTLLATAAYDGVLTLWDISNRASPVRKGGGRTRTDSQCSVTFSPDGLSLLAEGPNGTAVIWDVRRPGRLAPLGTLRGHSYAVFDLAYSADGRRAVTASGDGTAIVWDTTDPRAPTELARLSGHNGPVASVSLSADGNRVLTGGNDQLVMAWDVANAEPAVRAHFEPDTSLALYGLAVHEERGIAVTVDASDSAHLWDISALSSPRHLATIEHSVEPDPGEAFEPVLNPQGTLVLVPNGNDEVELWDISDPAKPVQVPGVSGSGGYPIGGQFDKEGATLTVWGNEPTESWSWAIRGERAVKRVPTPAEMSRSAYHDPTGRLALIPDYSKLNVWSVDESGMDYAGELDEHQQAVQDVVFTPDGQTMFSAAADDTIMAWDLTSGLPTRMATLRGHTATIMKLAVNRTGTLLASVSQDERVMIWDIGEPAESLRLVSLDEHSDVASEVAFVEGGRTLLTASYDGTVLAWDVSALNQIAEDPIAAACALISPGLDAVEWQRHSPGVPLQRSCST
jgi:WD40 repeat protein